MTAAVQHVTQYSRVARWLHWGMAALLAWQLGGMLLKDVLGRGPVTKFWVGSHASVGTLLLALIILRIIWALIDWRRRPAHQTGLIGLAARAGHALLYLLMLIVPAIALMRMIGDGKGVTLFGTQWVAPTGQTIPWMTAPANALHGNLAWLLLALIMGHIAMVVVHQWIWRDGTLSRMLGTAFANTR